MGGAVLISELASRTDTSQRLLRYYEEQGLLTPTRTSAGYRSYTDDDVATVRRIRHLLGAGLSTAIIASVLPCVRDEESMLVPTCSDSLAQLRQEHDRLSQAIDDLAASRAVLGAAISAA
jgi:DNA-binding transcriptional MerR regulator